MSARSPDVNENVRQRVFKSRQSLLTVLGSRGLPSPPRGLVTQLISLLDGLSDKSQVVVMAATNRLSTLDPALRRFGRFDLEIGIPVPTARPPGPTIKECSLQREGSKQDTFGWRNSV